MTSTKQESIKHALEEIESILVKCQEYWISLKSTKHSFMLMKACVQAGIQKRIFSKVQTDNKVILVNILLLFDCVKEWRTNGLFKNLVHGKRNASAEIKLEFKARQLKMTACQRKLIIAVRDLVEEIKTNELYLFIYLILIRDNFLLHQ